MRLVTITVPSPVGDWVAVADAVNSSNSAYSGAVRMCALVTAEHSLNDALERLWQDESEAVAGAGEAAHPVARALVDYFDGDVRALDAIACAQPGTAFRQQTWRAMRTVAPASPISYSQLAATAGRPAAVRAAASACAVNRIPLFVPCHRVLRSDGSIGDYYFGSEVKEWLLQHEAAHRG